MTIRWHAGLFIFAVSLTGLLIGATFWLAGYRGGAEWSWAAAAVPAAGSLFYKMLAAFRRLQVGVDLLAFIAIAGALALQQPLVAAVIALMLASGRLLESFAERRAAREMSALLARVPRSAHRYQDGKLVEVALHAIENGDRLLVRQGEVVMVDGMLTTERAVLDEAALTGEARLVVYHAGARLRSGALNAADAFEMQATAAAADSTYAGIVKLVEAARRSKAPGVRLADRYAFWFIPVSLGLAALAWLLSGEPLRALAVVVVATPCPLILAVPIAVVSGLSRCARRGILVKGGAALEALAGVETLFFDKTGTLTGGNARLVSIESVPPGNARELLAVAASVEQASNHVLAAAVVDAARARGLTLNIPSDINEVPGSGISARVNGRHVAVGAQDYIAHLNAIPPTTHSRLMHAAADGMSAVLVAIDGEFAGVLLLADQLRTESPRALRLLRRAGIHRIVMLTGDHREVAEAIGTGLGVDEVLAEQTPAEKLTVIKAASESAPTMMVGDGINDAPALAAASVGVALGTRGVAAATEAADVVLLVDRLDRLAEALHIARGTHAIAVQSVAAGMGLSVLAMLAAAAGYLPPLWGALLQEAIDVAVILNALRALRIRVLRASHYSLTPTESARLQSEHAELVPVFERLTAVADRLAVLPAGELRRELTGLEVLLREHLLPHERNDDREVYPAMAALLGGDDPMAALSRGHREIFRLHRQLHILITRLTGGNADAQLRQDLQRTLYALDAVLRLHFAQEEEIYQSLARA